MIRTGKLLEAWMTRRADAETVRLGFFNELVAAPGTTAGEVPLPLLKLEYFRRYQLDTQINFYNRRGAQHAASARTTLGLGAAAAFVAALSAGGAGGLGWGNPDWAALAALGVVGTALAAFASERESMHQDRRNAERYQRTQRALRELRAKLDEVREATAAQDAAVLPGFVAAVHEQLSLEHRQWRESGESSDSAAARLEQALARHRDQSAA